MSYYNIFNIPENEIAKIGKENQIYGHPTDKGLCTLINEINIIRRFYKIDYIYGIDLGCGDGYCINYFNKNIENCSWTGIELSEYRISLSTNPDIIMEGSLLEIDYKDYNFIYVNNLAFDDFLTNKLEEKILTEFNGIIFTTKPFESIKLIKKIKKICNLKTETNWNKNHIFNFYFLF